MKKVIGQNNKSSRKLRITFDIEEAVWLKLNSGKLRFWYDREDYPCNLFFEPRFGKDVPPDGKVEIIVCNPDSQGVKSSKSKVHPHTGAPKSCQTELFPTVNTGRKRSRQSK